MMQAQMLEMRRQQVYRAYCQLVAGAAKRAASSSDTDDKKTPNEKPNGGEGGISESNPDPDPAPDPEPTLDIDDAQPPTTDDVNSVTP